MVEMSLISLRAAVDLGKTISKDMEVVIHKVGNALLYGIIAGNNKLMELSISIPPLGKALIMSNRVIYKLGGQFHNAIIFDKVSKAEQDKYNIHLLYVPKFIELGRCTSYLETMKNETINPNISRMDGVKVEDDIAYYLTQEDDLLFQSSSMLRGIGNHFGVVTMRLSKVTDEVVYEVFNPRDVFVEKDALS